MSIEVSFIDGGRLAQVKPDPAFPKGQRIILTRTAIEKSCTKNIPWPAPRCGFYKIKCMECGYTAAISVAGRPDDPCMVTMPCRATKGKA